MKQGLLIIFLFLSSIAIAEPYNQYIKNLKAVAFESKLLVSWTTKSGFSCQDIVVQLSTDSVTFEDKAIYYGICGDTAERNYSIVIQNPFVNKLNYVRLNLGSYGTTFHVAEWVTELHQISIYPNPLTVESILFLDNEKGENLSIALIKANGQTISSFNTSSSEIKLWSYLKTKGLYYCRIHSSEGLLRVVKFVY